MQNILKEIIFWALLASCDFHNNEVQCPRKALLADAWSEILAGLSELGLTVITSLCTNLIEPLQLLTITSALCS